MSQPPPLTGDSLRAARVEAGLSQMQLAIESGVSRATIQNIEYGCEPSTRVARALRAAFERIAATPAPDRVAVLEAEIRDLRTRVDTLITRGAA